MNGVPDNHRRPDVREAFRRDAVRHARREEGPRTFWQSLRVLGMVGWPIALCSVGGTLLGRALDGHFHTGLRFTLMLLTAGAILGSYIAWRALGKRP